MLINKSRKEYNDYLYDRIKTKLTEAKEYELLSFAMIGTHLMLRQADILKLKWEQIDFENCVIKNAYRTKESVMRESNVTSNMKMPKELAEILRIWRNETHDTSQVFPNLKVFQVTDRIADITGIFNFNTHLLRTMGSYIAKFSDELALEDIVNI